ncbi:hypothetical protein RYZ26_10650 [Terasakiella sp. A23]|uniref:hypothetical protein n=1 Tax=Terasakiella sp. FCG-A23 TaxID=3080561 RepID=UPI00295374C0|nr:hypothetical protein [Terasakiella sp. A23]MDV7340054.1 hypothetical protein [Terasakiella sp. A23]
MIDYQTSNTALSTYEQIDLAILKGQELRAEKISMDVKKLFSWVSNLFHSGMSGGSGLASQS